MGGGKERGTETGQERASKYKEHLEKVGAAVTKLEGHVMDVQTENKTLSRQLVQEMGRSKASDAVTKKVQMQLHNVSIGIENLRKKNEAVVTSLLVAKEENLAHKRVVALAMQESGRVSKELKDLKAGRQARLAAEQRKWKKWRGRKTAWNKKCRTIFM
jgi:hypothetical protein